MKKAPFHYLALVCLLAGYSAKAQEAVPDSVASPVASADTASTPLTNEFESEKPAKQGRNSFYYKNNVKLGLSPILLGNYSLTYERVLNRFISASASYRIMPKTALNATPLTKTVMDQLADEGDEISEQLDNAKVSGNAITAEVRFYTGSRKTGARGFYGGVYGRYSSFKYDFPYDFEATDAGITKTVPFLGDSKGFGGGVLMGVQWQIKRVTIDFTILGAHWGKMTGNVNGQTDLSELSEGDQAQLKEDIEGVVNFIEDKKFVTATVDNNGVRGKIDAPFAGIRGLNLSIGFNF
ncbi:hypothetical protein [uncultured Chitinophaga sp.]|uniref:hypothetical protein n=1 Tax=uncultured Chitinophaga sp. TaxID=339340 RepID=UPI0025EE294A|nr:hypothetical protein [uncultured Chitinophaga sp.]